MIVVTVEIWPFGVESRRRTLGVGRIWNTAKGTRTRGEYEFELRDAGGKVWKTGALGDFPRMRLLAWDLLCRTLNVAIGNRNPKTESG